MILGWQKRRSEFNHDWLKNQFIPALAKWLRLLDDEIEDPKFEQEFVTSVLPDWEPHHIEAQQIIASFAHEMTPQRLFDQPPLARCDSRTKCWLASLIHGLWLARYPVKEWVRNTEQAVDRAQVAYRQIQDALRDCPDTRSAVALRPYRSQFAEFRDRCQQLAATMSKFPSEVLPV